MWTEQNPNKLQQRKKTERILDSFYIDYWRLNEKMPNIKPYTRSVDALTLPKNPLKENDFREVLVSILNAYESGASVTPKLYELRLLLPAILHILGSQAKCVKRGESLIWFPNSQHGINDDEIIYIRSSYCDFYPTHPVPKRGFVPHINAHSPERGLNTEDGTEGNLHILIKT